MSEKGANLAAIISAWTGMLRTGRIDELARLLDEQVVWQGLLPELVCHGRDQVLRLIGRSRRQPLRITRLEAEELGDRVAISVSGPEFPEGPDGPEGALLPPGAPRSLVFTFRDGHVVRMESLPSRDAAFAAAGV